MKQIITLLLKLLIFWFLFFAFTRCVFILYYYTYFSDIDFFQILSIFPHALHLDFSTVCYILALPVLLFTIYYLHPKRWINTLNFSVNGIFIVLYSLITTAELGIYSEWKSKLSSKVFRYFENPDEIYNSVSTSTFFLLLLIFIIQLMLGLGISKKWIFKLNPIKPAKFYNAILFILFSFSILLIGARGGVGQIPITQSNSYFSKHNIVNLTAVNSGWNIIKSINQNYVALNQNPFNYFDENEANRIVDKIYKTDLDSTIHLLKNKKPNIVLIILEGWSADLIESLGGEKGITPNFRSFEKRGILFSQIYSSGTRSEEGMSNIFSAFPSYPLSVITRQPDKFAKLPSIVKLVKENKYSSLFLFGGDLSYGNMKGFLYFNQFDKILEKTNFNKKYPLGKLGIHDEFMYPEFVKEVNKLKQPFLGSFYILSTHSPYDIPSFKKNIQWPEIEKEYVNAVYYADSCLGNFIKNVENEKWFKNTLFILVSDHSHSSYRKTESWSKSYQHIPMLMFGDVIKEEYQGTQCAKYGSQIDLANTVMTQLNLNTNTFKWSKNLLNPTTANFAYYSCENGFGWVCPEGYYFYDYTLNQFLENSIPVEKRDSLEKIGKSYIQKVYTEFLNF